MLSSGGGQDGSITGANQNIELIARLEAPYPADVLLFHPLDPSVFLVGTYLLDEQTRVRHGKICLYELSTFSSTDPRDNAKLISEVSCDAVLDMKWYNEKLYVGHSTGRLSVYTCSLAGAHSILQLLECKSVVEDGVLIMSLSLSDRGIMTSHSDGTMAIWTLDLQPVSMWRVAELEVWTQSWSRDENVVLSGSDDGVLAAWDLRMSTAQEAYATFTNRKTHGAGVTAILSSNDSDEILTGSYDDKIRRLDTRKPQVTIEEANLGGGVWRIIPVSKDRLLTCCMYEGAKIVERSDLSVVKHFQEHKSMVYGGDVSADVVGTCSFYDKTICIWR